VSNLKIVICHVVPLLPIAIQMANAWILSPAVSQHCFAALLDECRGVYDFRCLFSGGCIVIAVC
jgi:hypothetical protein